MELVDIERSIIKKYRKQIWSPFIKAIKEFELINDGDKVAVAISGGKDSLLLAKVIEELNKHSKVKFDVAYISMDPGYDPRNRQQLEKNLDYLGIDGQIFDTEVFKIAEEVYLSLLMIDGKQKRNGLGSRIYSQLEQLFQAEGADRIRIDVVYEDNVVAFWGKQGFIPCEKIQLEWNGHKSNAIKMVKTISFS